MFFCFQVVFRNEGRVSQTLQVPRDGHLESGQRMQGIRGFLLMVANIATVSSKAFKAASHFRAESDDHRPRAAIRAVQLKFNFSERKKNEDGWTACYTNEEALQCYGLWPDTHIHCVFTLRDSSAQLPLLLRDSLKLGPDIGTQRRPGPYFLCFRHGRPNSRHHVQRFANRE